MLDNPTQLVLVGDNGQIGTLNVNLVPADEEGNPIDPETLLDDDLIEDPMDLKGKKLDFVLQISDGTLPSNFC